MFLILLEKGLLSTCTKSTLTYMDATASLERLRKKWSCNGCRGLRSLPRNGSQCLASPPKQCKPPVSLNIDWSFNPDPCYCSAESLEDSGLPANLCSSFTLCFHCCLLVHFCPTRVMDSRDEPTINLREHKR